MADKTGVIRMIMTRLPSALAKDRCWVLVTVAEPAIDSEISEIM